MNIAVLSYTVLISLWLVARQMATDDHWLVSSANHFAIYLFFPLPILLLLSIWKGTWKWLGMLAVPSIAFLVLFGDTLFPMASEHRNDGGQVIRVMTYNVLNRNDQYDSTTRVIVEQDPDLIGLQELIPANASEIEPALERSGYLHHTPLPEEHRLEVALFSRYPILESRKLDLPWNDLSRYSVVEIENVRLHVYVLHLVPTVVHEVGYREWPGRIAERQAIRMEQIDRLFEEFPVMDEPILVLCDCNFTETSDAYARFAGRLRDGFRDAGWGLGHTLHPIGFPFGTNRIDYVWYSHHFAALDAHVARAGESDHWAVVVELMLGPESQPQ